MIPTQEAANLAALTGKERAVYGLIRAHYLAQFLPDHEFDRTTLMLSADDQSLRASGKQIVVTGWKRTLINGDDERTDSGGADDEACGQSLPKLPEGARCPIEQVELKALKTQAPKPFTQGELVKTGRTQFAVLDRTLVTETPNEGDKVRVEPYARRRFDGLRADTPEEQSRMDSSGKSYTVQIHMLGSAPVKLPIPEPCCPELRELIHQMEELPAPDGFRRITHLLVDAGARDFTWVDPLPDDILRTPPCISFTVDTGKFKGRVSVLYDRCLDFYAVELYRNGKLVERVDEVYFNTLGQTLERLIDDGRWKLI
ncbi:MAG: hypothetical protein LBI87_00645, partial [Candidatus Accumulibacter sp.]|nr:hypothetical protein [Accumulibacter sp.]